LFNQEWGESGAGYGFRKVVLTCNAAVSRPSNVSPGIFVQLQRRYARVAIDHLESPVLCQIVHVWDEKRNGRAYPSREELRPHDFSPFLRHLSLARVLDGCDDFEIRIVGDEIVQAYGENLTGRTLSSLGGVVGDAMLDAYHAVVAEGGPILLHGFFEQTRNHHFRREVVLMPLGMDGKVNFVLSGGILMPRDSDTRRNRDLARSAAA
jgi:hypothetical protein